MVSNNKSLERYGCGPMPPWDNTVKKEEGEKEYYNINIIIAINIGVLYVLFF
jgi:hypothetical protein